MNANLKVPGNFISSVRWQMPVRPAANSLNMRPLPITSLDNARASDRVQQAAAARRASTLGFSILHASQAFSGSNPTVDRSAQNIASWTTYLPKECVAMMISLGWDHST
jgi:hypothetical protein